MRDRERDGRGVCSKWKRERLTQEEKKRKHEQ